MFVNVSKTATSHPYLTRAFQQDMAHSKKEKKSQHLTAKEAIGTFGFGLLMSWITLCYFSGPFFLGEAGSGSGLPGGMQLIGLSTFALLMIICFAKSDFVAGISIRAFALAPLACGLVLPALMLVSQLWIPIPPALQIAAWGINGLASACAMLMWANYYCCLSRRAILPSVVIAFLVSGFWYSLVLLIPVDFKGVGVYASLVLSVACILIYQEESPSQAFVSKKDSEANVGLDVRTSISLYIAGCAQGYLLQRILFNHGDGAFVIIGSAFVLCAVLTLVLSRVYGTYSLLLAPYFRISLLPLVAGLLVLPFLGGAALMICEALMLAILLEHFISIFVNITYAIKKYEVQAFYLWTRTHIPSLIGLAGGWGVGFLVLAILGSEAHGSFLVVLVFSLAFTLLLTFSATVAPYGCDHLTIPEDYEYDDVESMYRSVRKAWGKACDIIAMRTNLTPRETEVFLLLAKGRNSKVIERELSISSHTVKSHNYNIYRKLGVCSQQELIDLIESVHLDIKLTD